MNIESRIQTSLQKNEVTLDLSSLLLSELPDSIAQLNNLQYLNIAHNNLKVLPDTIGNLIHLKGLDISGNEITNLPDVLKNLINLEQLIADKCFLENIPEWIGELKNLRRLVLKNNRIHDVPYSLVHLEHLIELSLNGNPLYPELLESYNQGVKYFLEYIKITNFNKVFLNESKVIFVGEGEVGKTCLLDALAENPWMDHDSTHGIQITSIKAKTSSSHKHITLNCWDFGGQRVYRPTHQLFFSSPAVYLLVWKPREGINQGFVKEWIKLIIHREPSAKIIIVATHGGPQQRQPDIDRQEIYDLFGKENIVDFFFVDSKPKVNGERKGINELRQKIADIAETLPDVGRSVPKKWQEVKIALLKEELPYISYQYLLDTCRKYEMDDTETNLFVRIYHRLGYFIHYEHDPTLRDIVILKPDWLTTALSFVLDDDQTRVANGLVPHKRLSLLWNNPEREEKFRYSEDLHPIFIRLMERFDISYRVMDISLRSEGDHASLIAQLVPDNRPESRIKEVWPFRQEQSNIQQEQLCKITNIKNGETATAEGLFFQLIVRLHRYSLGRNNFHLSVHWQRGMILDADYNGRALIEHIGNDIKITVRAPFPGRFLTMLTEEVKFLIESFWEGLKCDVMVPCISPCGKGKPGTGFFEVEKLIGSKKENRIDYPCIICNQWQLIDRLLSNAPAMHLKTNEELLEENINTQLLKSILRQLSRQGELMVGRFDNLDNQGKRILSIVDGQFINLLNLLTDESKEGPRIFSLVPVNRRAFNPKKWVKQKFKLTVWCEHSKLPASMINGNEEFGVYEIEITNQWFKKAIPFLKTLHTTLSLVLPVAVSGIKLALDDKSFKAIEEELEFSSKMIESSVGASEKFGFFVSKSKLDQHLTPIELSGYRLKEIHSVIKEQDPFYKSLGLVRVLNKRKEFIWVHPNYEGEY